MEVVNRTPPRIKIRSAPASEMATTPVSGSGKSGRSAAFVWLHSAAGGGSEAVLRSSPDTEAGGAAEAAAAVAASGAAHQQQQPPRQSPRAGAAKAGGVGGGTGLRASTQIRQSGRLHSPAVFSPKRPKNEHHDIPGSGNNSVKPKTPGGKENPLPVSPPGVKDARLSIGSGMSNETRLAHTAAMASGEATTARAYPNLKRKIEQAAVTAGDHKGIKRAKDVQHHHHDVSAVQPCSPSKAWALQQQAQNIFNGNVANNNVNGNAADGLDAQLLAPLMTTHQSLDFGTGDNMHLGADGFDDFHDDDELLIGGMGMNNMDNMRFGHENNGFEFNFDGELLGDTAYARVRVGDTSGMVGRGEEDDGYTSGSGEGEGRFNNVRGGGSCGGADGFSCGYDNAMMEDSYGSHNSGRRQTLACLLVEHKTSVEVVSSLAEDGPLSPTADVDDDEDRRGGAGTTPGGKKKKVTKKALAAQLAQKLAAEKATAALVKKAKAAAPMGSNNVFRGKRSAGESSTLKGQLSLSCAPSGTGTPAVSGAIGGDSRRDEAAAVSSPRRAEKKSAAVVTQAAPAPAAKKALAKAPAAKKSQTTPPPPRITRRSPHPKR